MYCFSKPTATFVSEAHRKQSAGRRVSFICKRLSGARFSSLHASEQSEGEEKMSRQGPLCLLTCMAAMAVSSMAFNIDEANPKIYKGEEKDFFGYKVLQFISGKEKGQVLLLSS
ncbi:unnamed protein product [Oncorhynchus mykiss]|uniref:Uncharacterized protein n=1 Tax=Oncorhynchus mykiss TaxID=8022 RepID=A0A060WP32_ONCMY|nr:unnamed protein product [Oncorhynchus mykiss]